MAEWSRWDKYGRAPWRQDSSASASDGWRREDQEQLVVSGSPIEKGVMDAVEDYLEKCAQVIVKIDLVENLPRPENLEVSFWYVLKHASYEGSNIFQLFDTAEKPNHLVGSRKRWLESQVRDDARQENGRKRLVRSWVSRSQGKSSTVHQQHSADSSASAKLVVGQR